MQLSIVMMVKNESKHLEQCLKSLQPILKTINSELIIVDTGSQDNTVEISRRFTNKVYFHKWNNDFADMRNKTISYAKGDWIFVVDGDEILETPQDIIDFFSTNKHKKYNTGVIKIRNYTKEEKKYSLLSLARLFKKHKKFRYTGAIHEQPTIAYPVYYFNATLLHYGYLATDKELVERKFIRNTAILKKELQKEPKNIYYWFQLSQSYACHGDYEEALEANLKAYSIAKEENIDLSKTMYVYTHLAQLYYWLQKYDELEKICEEAIDAKDGYIDIYYYLGKASQKLLKHYKSIEAYEKYLSMVFQYENFIGYNDITVTTNTLDIYEHVYGELSILYTQKKNYETALKYISKIKSLDVIKAILETIINAYLNLDKIEGLKAYYDDRILGNHEELVIEFTSYLESFLNKYKKHNKHEITKTFSQGHCHYALLNKFRILDNRDLSSTYIEAAKALDFNQLPAYYGEIIYKLLKKDYKFQDLVINVRENKLRSYFQYSIDEHKDEFIELAIQYIQNNFTKSSLRVIRITKSLEHILLLSNHLKNKDFQFILKKYIQDGIFYINKIYRKEIIENEDVYSIKDKEDGFFIYMNHAMKSKNADDLEYVRYLKKALNLYPEMKNGIEFLTKEINIELQQKNPELEAAKLELKNKIQELLNNGELQQAEVVIEQYKSIMGDDENIISMKSVIAMMKDNLRDAKNILYKGTFINPNNCDLLYNMAYLYQLKGEYSKTRDLYEKILILTNDQDLKIEIQNNIENLDYEKKEQLDKNGNKQNDAKKKELEKYKKDIKRKINELIELGYLDDSIKLIKEYESMIPNDIEILMYKSQIAIIEN